MFAVTPVSCFVDHCDSKTEGAQQIRSPVAILLRLFLAYACSLSSSEHFKTVSEHVAFQEAEAANGVRYIPPLTTPISNSAKSFQRRLRDMQELVMSYKYNNPYDITVTHAAEYN